MKFLDAIAAEHRLIDAVAGALRTWAEAAGGDGAEPADGERFVRFFRDFAGGFHHAREEGVLFPALVREAELRADAGPLAALTAQHRAMERALETLAGLVAARAQGRVGGNPRLKARDPAALARLAEARRAAQLAALLPSAEVWLAEVRRLRPGLCWQDVAGRVNAALPPGTRPFTPLRLARLARRFVAEGLLEARVLEPATPAAGRGRGRARTAAAQRAAETARAYLQGRPDATLAELGAQLLRLGVRPPRGGEAWAPSSLKALVDCTCRPSWP